MTVVERGVLTDEARAELVALSKGKDVVGVVALRARIVLWWNEGRSAREIVSLSGMSEPTVRLSGSGRNGMKPRVSTAFLGNLIRARGRSTAGKCTREFWRCPGSLRRASLE